MSFDTDRRRAMEDTRNWAALALTPEEKMKVEDPPKSNALPPRFRLSARRSRWIVSDDPDEHIEKIRTYVALGFRHLVFHAPGADQTRFLQLYTKHVLPLLRKELG